MNENAEQAEKFQKPYVPVYDKTKKEIISMSAGKSVDMTDINHGHVLGRENRFKNLLTRLNKQANLCKLQSYKNVAINFKLPNKVVSKTLQSTVEIIHIKHRYSLLKQHLAQRYITKTAVS